MNKKLSFIMYHFIRNKNKKFPNINSIDVNFFNKQIKYFKSKFNIITIQELIDSFENNYKIAQNSIILTFDDGYIDHFENVLEILLDNKVYGSFYPCITSSFKHKILIPNKIHFILSKISEKKIYNDLNLFIEKYQKLYKLKKLNFYKKNYFKPSVYDSEYKFYIKFMINIILPNKFSVKVSDYLFKKYITTDVRSFAKKLYLSKNHIIQLKKLDMHIGLHGYDHQSFNKLTISEINSQITLNKQYLSKINCLDNDNLSIAYPYGSYDIKINKCLIRHNIKLGLTTLPGPANLNKNDLLKIPRIDTINV